jgi:hypothetical protein
MLDELPADFDLRAHYAGVRSRMNAASTRATRVKSYREPIGPLRITRDVLDLSIRQLYGLPIGPKVPERDPRTGELLPPMLRARLLVFDVLFRHPRVTWSDILSSRRMGFISLARQIVCWRLSKFTLMSLPEIGKLIGKDHTTVLHAVRKIDRLLASGKLTIEQTGGRAQP